MTGAQIDELWELIQRRWPGAQAAKSPEVIGEWSASLMRLEYGDAMTAVIRLSEEETWFPQTVAPIMTRAAEEKAKREREHKPTARNADFNLTAFWIAEVREYQRRYGMDDDWLRLQLAEIGHAEQVGKQARTAFDAGPEAARKFLREQGAKLAAGMDAKAVPVPPEPPLGGKDRALPVEVEV